MATTPIPVPRRAAERGLSYRAAVDSDERLLARIYGETRTEELALTGWNDAQKAAFLDHQHRAQHSHYREHFPDARWLLIEKGPLPVGRLYLELWSRELRIIDIALLPAFRQQGLGGAILADLIEDTEALGRSVSIHVEKNNPARRLYDRLGFEPRGEIGIYDLMVRNPLPSGGSQL